MPHYDEPATTRPIDTLREKEQYYLEQQAQAKQAMPLGAQMCNSAESSAGEYNPPRMASQRLSLSNVDAAFQYQPWNCDQQQRGEQVREALVAAAKAILRSVPECPQRTRALNNLIDARMIANAAITFDGRF